MNAFPLRCLAFRRSASRIPTLSACVVLLTHLLPSCTPAASASTSASVSSPAPAHVVPLETPRGEFWSRRAGLLRYHCEDLALHARSRISPSARFVISKGPFNAVDCAAAVASLEEKGCICDEARLRCLETERIEPAAFVCNGDLKCLVFEGKKKGVVRIVDVGEHITRSKCEAELKEIERATQTDVAPTKPVPAAPPRRI